MLGQIAGAAEAIQSASREGWEVVLLVVIVLAVCGLSGWLIKTTIADGRTREERIIADSRAREERLSNDARSHIDRLTGRVTKLEEYIEQSLMGALKDCTGALIVSNQTATNLVLVINELSKALAVRPCFWSPERQAELLARNAVEIVRQNPEMVTK